jgi:hypothetical protein
MRTLLLLALVTGCDLLTLPAPASNGPEATAISATRLVLAPDRGPPIDAVRVQVALGAHARPTRADVTTATLAGASPRIFAANANLATLPLVIVEPETTRTVDLYFALPAGASSVAITWPLVTSNGPFEVHALLEVDDDVSPEQVRDRWWFAPGYAWSTFRHADGIITREPPRAATIHELDRERDCDRW